MDGKTIITITASTSTSRLGQPTLDSLKTAGFEPTNPKFYGNDALCAARLDTMKKVIISIFTKALTTSETDLLNKVDIQQVSKPSQGAGPDYQYIKASITQTGTKIPDSQKLVCDTVLNQTGVQGTLANNYCGFKKDLYIATVPGKSISIEFNPKRIPDMVFIKYGDIEFLSTWLGGTSIHSEPNFVTQLNKTLDLEAKINAELAACGSTGTVATLRPNAKVGGKWRVFPGKEQSGDQKTYTFPLGEKAFNKDKLIVRCFAPLGNTEFSITAKCSPS